MCLKSGCHEAKHNRVCFWCRGSAGKKGHLVLVGWICERCAKETGSTHEHWKP